MEETMVRLAKSNRSFLKIIGRALLLILIALIIGSVIAHFIWKYSGDGEWAPVGEKNGVKVFVKKIPGQTLEIYKGVIQAELTHAGVTKFMQDPSVCDDIGCYDSKMFEWINEQEQYYVSTFNLPGFFKPRQLVSKISFVKEQTGSLIIRIQAMPDKLPVDDCCFRVREMDNKWEFKPVSEKEMLVTYEVNMNEGGWLPYFLLNNIRSDLMFSLPGLTKLMQRDKYQNAQFDFLQATKSGTQSE